MERQLLEVFLGLHLKQESLHVNVFLLFCFRFQFFRRFPSIWPALKSQGLCCLSGYLFPIQPPEDPWQLFSPKQCPFHLYGFVDQNFSKNAVFHPVQKVLS